MAYKALYRKYRPNTFDEVAGQQHIVKTIKNALATGKIAHAYLFAGPRGTGKTTMAKLLAKALNCDEGIGKQCNECKNCIAINEGTHPDVLEIDAASNNGVDEVRDLIDKVKYSTILGKYKVYIIDEVHMMTTGAFNALLKTLEEPPEHVIFILATTEPHKILPTILSRCQRYDFSKVSDDDIRNRLKDILEKENVVYNEAAINLIITLSEGGMRDALSILDQVLAYSSNRLIEDDVLDIFALESTTEKVELLTSIGKGDFTDVLDRLKSYVSRGTDIKRLTDDLLVLLKDVLIYRATNRFDFVEQLNKKEISALSSLFNEKQTIEMIDILMNALKDYKNVTSITPIFEVMLLKLSSLKFEKKEPVTVVKEAAVSEIKEEKVIENAAEISPIALKEEPVVKEKVEVKKQEVVEEPTFSFSSVVLNEKPLILNGAEHEESYAIDDNMMIKIMAKSKKEIKTAFLDSWKKIKQLNGHPVLDKASMLLIDGHPLVAGNKILILEYPLDKAVTKVNTQINQKDIQNVIFNMFGRKMFVYAVSRRESIRLQKMYMDLVQVSKLPKISDISLEFKGE
ncbi:MAG TPA: DNA polymerase III subunit gamma/tau [Bacilli bacterium]|nr:DNA polymerase III subunit gamma/tau [Bacilli bacterium]